MTDDARREPVPAGRELYEGRPRLVVWNPNAGSTSQAADVRAWIEAHPDFEILERPTPEEAMRAIRERLEEGPRIVIPAGGDGTVHTVINGLADCLDRVCLAVLPLGTGNDFSRTLGVPLDPIAALESIATAPARELDLVQASFPGYLVLFANTAVGGNSDRVTRNLTSEEKQLWGPLSYLARGVDVLFSLETYRIEVAFDGAAPRSYSAFNVLIGNGRTVAGGLNAAPHANPEDGQMDLILVLESPLLDTALLAGQLMMSDYLDSPNTVFHRARRVDIRSEPTLFFSLDGVRYDGGPVTFTVRPRALRVLVGPDYVVEPPMAELIPSRLAA